MSVTPAQAPALAPCEDPVSGVRRLEWAFWRSPPEQPGWARPVLLGVAAVAALLYAWNITSAGLAPFYSVAVKSMSESWKAFFYGAFDPRATITIDKLAGSFLPQALSARVFGYHAWSLALPQVVEGVISVLVMYRVVRRWAGVAPGLLAAGILALTPIAASMFGHSMEDGALTMCLVLAADAYQRAVMSARWQSLMWAGVWTGLGFQAKMLQAWIILPALAIGYLLSAPVRLGRRLWHLGAAGVVTLAVSLSWIALYTFTPANDRPYVDGSTDNSAVAMVFGYNGLERFGITVKGAVASTFGGGGGRALPSGAGPGLRASPSPAPAPAARTPGTRARAGQPPAGGSPPGGTLPSGLASPGTGTPSARRPARPAGRSGTRTGSGAASRRARSAGTAAAYEDINVGGFLGDSGGWTKLAGARFGPQIGWLYPLALLTLVFGLAWRGRARRTDQLRGGLVMWGVWLLTFGIIYSDMNNIPHTAYMASLAPPIAALSGAGIVLFWGWYRHGDARWWAAPLAVAAELAWAAYLWRSYPGFLPWARQAAIAVGIAAVIVLVLARAWRRARARLAIAGLTAGVAAMLAAPAAWAASVLDARYAGTSFDASAGPGGFGGFGPGGSARPGPRTYPALAGRYGPPGADAEAPPGAPQSAARGGGPQAGTGAGLSFLTTATALSGSEQRLYAYLSAHRDGASYLMAVQSWSQASAYIVATGQEVLPIGGFSGSVPEPTVARVKQLVTTGQLRFFLVGSGSGALRGPGTGDATESQQVANWVRASCTVVQAKDYGGATISGPAAASADGSTLYECAKHAARISA